jgi:hypothetical protein
MNQGMEGKAEKTKSKPEADYAFDPISATADQWKAYVLNPKNFEKDFARGDFPFTTPASTILEKIRQAGTPRSVIENAVQAVLEKWDDLVMQNVFLRDISPIEFVATLANESTVDIAQKLWTNAPQGREVTQTGMRQAADGLGVHIPLDQEGLEKLYKEQFAEYSFTALEIMLKRGEVARASELFETHVSEYPKARDPVMLDHLVRLGLPASSAKKWLDQSVNKPGDGYKFHYDEALERWGYKPEGQE